MNKTVKYEVDLASLPPLTSSQEAELKALSAMPDSQIDYSDIPPLTDDFWQSATRNPFYKPQAFKITCSQPEGCPPQLRGFFGI